MFQTFRNAWKIRELRNKILFTLLILLIFRIGSAITVPFVNPEAFSLFNAEAQNNFMQIVSMMSGGGFSDASIFALSITPYINASIIIQLLTVAIPALERLAKDGENGRKKLATITRYVTVALGLLLGVAYYFMILNNEKHPIESFSLGWDFLIAVMIVLTFTAGSALMMWLGEQINEKGIGNGISMLLFAGILSRTPVALMNMWNMFYNSGILALSDDAGNAMKYLIGVPMTLVIFIVMIGFIVFMTNAERRVPVQYAKRVVGRKMYGGQNTFIPIKVNMSGVMPIILAVSIISLPMILGQFVGAVYDNGGYKAGWNWLSWFESTHPFYVVLYFVLIIAFAFFYVTSQYNPLEMANNLRRNSGVIPGYRPGKPTSDYIKRVINKVTFIGAVFLGIVAVFPSVFGVITEAFGVQGLGAGLTIGGTSIMIVVSVALETTQQIESQMMMRHYKGFLE